MFKSVYILVWFYRWIPCFPDHVSRLINDLEIMGFSFGSSHILFWTGIGFYASVPETDDWNKTINHGCLWKIYSAYGLVFIHVYSNLLSGRYTMHQAFKIVSINGYRLTCQRVESESAKASAPALPELPAELMIDEQTFGSISRLKHNM